jgi:hypothetical protein
MTITIPIWLIIVLAIITVSVIISLAVFGALVLKVFARRYEK